VRAQGYDMPVDPEEGLATESDRPADVGISAFLTDRFLEWLPGQDEPWFVHLSHLRPHPPFAAAGEWARAYERDSVDLPNAAGSDLHPLHEFLLSISYFAAPEDEAGLREMRAQYYGMISDVDHQLGRVRLRHSDWLRYQSQAGQPTELPHSQPHQQDQFLYLQYGAGILVLKV
jgi:arylsulfatase A-like enzyme